MQQFTQSMLAIAIQMLNENTEFTRNYLDNPDFQNFINQRVFDSVYQKVAL
jgi:type I restriction enzyme R subunit